MNEGKKEQRSTATMNTATTTITHISFLLIAALFFVPVSEASIFSWRKRPLKTVTLTNNHTNYLSVRCYNFNDALRLQHLKPNQQFKFNFQVNGLLASTAMYNCSTNMGVFVSYRHDYMCGNDTINKCDWKFDLKGTYRYSPTLGDWEFFDYNPNYESLFRGGVVQNKYTNKK
ncbi:unnamed protein product [Ilex paraguariensis]|uniref:S-protein homolog n=1 Tax=Ilex paraguariensis TaxID=185542 RepID=A0ABC8QTK5_9AQUA